MTLIWHQFKKDLRQHWPWMTLWWLLAAWLGIRFSDYFYRWKLHESEVYKILTSDGWIVFVYLFVLAMLIEQLIHAEPLSGTTAFWKTRPLPRSRLLAAKILFVAFVVVLPLIVANTFSFWTYHISVRHTLWMIPGVVVWIIGPCVAFMTLAALTPNVWKFFLWAVIIFFFGMFILWAFYTAQEHWFPPIPTGDKPEPFIVLSSFYISIALTVIGGGIILVYLYLTSRGRTAWILIFLLIPAVLWNALFNKHDLFHGKERSLAYSTFLQREIPGAAQIDLQIDPKSGQLKKDYSYEGDNKILLRDIRLRFSVNDSFPDMALFPGRVTASFSPAAGPVLNSLKDRYINSSLLQERKFVAKIGAHLKVSSDKIYNLQTDLTDDFEGDFMKVPLTQLDALKSQRGTLSGTLSFSAVSFEHSFELPLQPGASWSNGTQTVTIHSVTREKDGCKVFLTEGTVALLFDPWVMIRLAPSYFHQYVALYHPQRGELYFPDESSYRFSSGNRSFEFTSPGNWIDQDADVLWFNGPENKADRNSPPITEEWLRGARLVVIVQNFKGMITKPFVVKDFGLNLPLVPEKE